MAITKKRKVTDDKQVAQSKWTEKCVFVLKVLLYGTTHIETDTYLKQGHWFKCFQKPGKYR